MEYKNINFSQRFKELRIEKGKTQIEIAKDLDVSKSTIAMWETNKRTPDFEKTEEIADYFNVDMDYLLGRKKKSQIVYEQIALSQNELALIEMYRNKENDEQVRKIFELLAFYQYQYTKALEEEKGSDQDGNC